LQGQSGENLGILQSFSLLPPSVENFKRFPRIFRLKFPYGFKPPLCANSKIPGNIGFYKRPLDSAEPCQVYPLTRRVQSVGRRGVANSVFYVVLRPHFSALSVVVF
jgi:hypothetical protein